MPRRRVLPAALLTVTAAVAVTTASPASAADLPVSQSRGFFLAGSVAGTDIVQAANLPVFQSNPLTGAIAVNTGGPTVTQANPQGLGSLSQLGVPGPSNTSIPVGQGLELGLLNQYATASPDGSAASASGAIADNGTIQVGSGAAGEPGSATVDLAKLGAPLTSALPSPLGALGDVSLTAGALAARAEQAPFDANGNPGVQQGSYQLGSLTLTAQGPTLLSTALRGLLTQFSSASSTFQDSLTAALKQLPIIGSAATVTITGLPDPSKVFDNLTSVSVDGVTVDFATNTVTIDLGTLIQTVTGKNINALDPNTDVVALLQKALSDPAIAAKIAAAIQAAIEAGQTELVNDLGNATVSATVVDPVTNQPSPVTLPTANLISLLGSSSATSLPGYSTFATAVTTLTSSLSAGLGSLLGTLGTGLSQLIGLVANRQVASNGQFTVTALALTLLPGGVPGAPFSGPLLDLGLANASVGPGAPLPPTSTTTTPTPQSETPMLANTGPAETLGGLAIGTWALVAGIALMFAANAVRRTRRLHTGTHRG